MHDDAVLKALEHEGVIDLSGLRGHPARAADRRGLVLVQSRTAVAATQPIGPRQLMHAAVMNVEPPVALLSMAALWAHGHGPEPELIEVGVVETRGLALCPPVVARRLAAATLGTIVVRRELPVVPLELAVIQSCAHLKDAEGLALVERVLRRRSTLPRRLRDTCARGLEGSARVRAALRALDGGDLELQKRRLRAALESAGVTGLRSEVRLESAAGGSCYLDFLHEPTRKGLELDGLYHDLPAQRRIDRHRDRWVRREHGIEMVRIADEEVRRDLRAVVDELLPQLLAP